MKPLEPNEIEGADERTPQQVSLEAIFASPELFEQLLETLDWFTTDSVEDLERRAEQARKLIEENQPA